MCWKNHDIMMLGPCCSLPGRVGTPMRPPRNLKGLSRLSVLSDPGTAGLDGSLKMLRDTPDWFEQIHIKKSLQLEYVQ